MTVSVASGKLRLKLGLQKKRNLEKVPASMTRKLLMKIMNGVCGVVINYHRSFIITSYFVNTLNLLLWNKGYLRYLKTGSCRGHRSPGTPKQSKSNAIPVPGHRDLVS
jgi:hypothetical protein